MLPAVVLVAAADEAFCFRMLIKTEPEPYLLNADTLKIDDVKAPWGNPVIMPDSWSNFKPTGNRGLIVQPSVRDPW
jgi:hypothetical protein